MSFRGVLGQFRDAVHEEAGQCEPPVLSWRERSRTKPALRWAVAAVVAIVLGAIPFYENARERQRAANQATADQVLMEQVDEGLSRSVPLAMSPLAGY
jgi:CTP:molybdopterin cytidylyltransferase MocA